MLRITQTPAVQLTTIHLDGKLLSPWLDEVRSVISGAQAQGAVRLNLSGLIYVDPHGAELLRTLRQKGMELTGESDFIAGLLAQSKQQA